MTLAAVDPETDCPLPCRCCAAAGASVAGRPPPVAPAAAGAAVRGQPGQLPARVQGAAGAATAHGALRVGALRP